MEKNPVVFLAIPRNSLPKKLQNFLLKNFDVDDSILLPVENGKGEGKADFASLTPEMILSGMLKVISVCGNFNSRPLKGIVKEGDVFSDLVTDRIPPEWVQYYRTFVLSVKPEIYHEFTGASIVKAGNGDFDMALEINAVLEGLFPGSPGVLLNKAQILESKAAVLEKTGHNALKENDEALKAYNAALSAEPLLSDTLFNVGFFFMSRRDFTRARDYLTRYLSDGNSSEIPPEKKKQAEKAIQDMSGYGQDDLDYQEAYDCIAGGRDEEGLIKIRKFIEKHPKVWNGWFILGWALRKLGRFSDGLESFKKAAELGGASCDVRNETAICLMELGDLKGARRELETALKDEPENIKIISNLGVLAMKSGRKDEASAFFRTVLELDSSDPLAGHFLEKNR